LSSKTFALVIKTTAVIDNANLELKMTFIDSLAAPYYIAPLALEISFKNYEDGYHSLFSDTAPVCT
jgi:hypothetical protein